MQAPPWCYPSLSYFMDFNECSASPPDTVLKIAFMASALSSSNKRHPAKYHRKTAISTEVPQEPRIVSPLRYSLQIYIYVCKTPKGKYYLPNVLMFSRITKLSFFQHEMERLLAFTGFFSPYFQRDNKEKKKKNRKGKNRGWRNFIYQLQFFHFLSFHPN